MNYQAEYQAKLTTAAEAIRLITKRGNISIDMAASEPPLWLKTLDNRINAPVPERIEALKVYYMHFGPASHNTIIKYENMGIIKSHSLFFSKTEQALALVQIAHPQFQDSLPGSTEKIGFL